MVFKKAVQQGRSERKGESYSLPYGEPLSDARTPLTDFFNTLLESRNSSGQIIQPLDRRLPLMDPLAVQEQPR